MKAESATLTGSVVSSVLASACCLGPLVLTMLGISGAAAARQLEPFRPYLLAVTAVLLGAAFYLEYRPRQVACGPGEACEMPRVNRFGRIALWFGTVVVLLSATFPWYSVYLF